jgi:hypothetical protein
MPPPGGHGVTGREHALVCHCSNRTLVRSIVILAALAAGTTLAWRAWKLPHASDDWIHTEPSGP